VTEPRDTQVLTDEDIKTEWRRGGASRSPQLLADPDAKDADGQDSDSTDSDSDTTDSDSDSTDSDSDSTDSTA
jgi:hypothetical protein